MCQHFTNDIASVQSWIVRNRTNDLRNYRTVASDIRGKTAILEWLHAEKIMTKFEKYAHGQRIITVFFFCFVLILGKMAAKVDF